MIPIVNIFKKKPKLKKLKNVFIIHQHQAKRAGLHWDLRIEHDGILESWASRKIPDLVEGKVNKIILFLQPQHQIEWFDFEGEIPAGYGAGKVEIWDKGNCITSRWEDKIITLKFEGTKIKGKYTLIHYKANEWLFFQSH